MLRVLVIGIAGILIIGFSLVAYVGLSPAAAPAPPPVMVSVVGAAHAVQAGSLLQPGDLAAVEMPAAQVPEGARTDSAEARNALVGAMVRRTLGERSAINAADVLRPGDRGFLAAVLEPGTRAVSVGVDAVSGAAGLIWPGDRVDVILTQTIEDADQSPGRRVAGETVLGDVRVIAVDQHLVQGGQAGGLLEERAPASRTITLEVTPQDAARIAVATRLGKLQVVLRAAQPGTAETAAADPAAKARDHDPRPAPALAMPASAPAPARSPGVGAPVWGGDVSRALAPSGAGRATEVKLFQGTKAVEAYKF